MSIRVCLVALVTVVAVLATMTVITTAPQMVTAHRIHKRLVADAPAIREPIPIRTSREAVRWISRLQLLDPLHRIVRKHRDRRADRRIPDAIDQVVRQLRAGSTLPIALHRVGSDDPVLSRLAAEIGRGRPLPEAIDDWRSEVELPNRTLAATALELASTTGGASARVLDGVAASLRERVALEREVAALSSQSRASAAVLVVAPVAFTVASAMFDHRILDVLLGRPIGWVCMGLGLGLDGLGALWMARLIGRHR